MTFDKNLHPVTPMEKHEQKFQNNCYWEVDDFQITFWISFAVFVCGFIGGLLLVAFDYYAASLDSPSKYYDLMLGFGIIGLAINLLIRFIVFILKKYSLPSFIYFFEITCKTEL